MLKLLRESFKHLKFILWAVVAVFVLLIFVDWGAGRASRGDRSPMAGVALKIGDTSISEARFLNEVRSTEQRFRQMYGDRFEAVRSQFDLGSMAVQNIVDRTLLLTVARRMSIDCSDDEVIERITAMQAFKRQDGSFVGTDLYNRILRSNNTSPEEFEASLRQEVVLEKLQRSLAAAIVVPDADVERDYRDRNETVAFDVLFVPADRAMSGVSVSEAEAKAFYDGNQGRFSHPEQKQLRYLLVDDARLRRNLQAPAAQVAEYYSSHQDEFTSGEEVKARHILIKPATTDDAGWKAAEAKALDLARKAGAAGADFAALARLNSDDNGSKEGGGDLGWFGRKRMVPEFENAAFALKAQEVSAPVKSQYGYHIIKVEDRRTDGVKPLAEVSDQIRVKLTEGLVDGEGNRRASALREKIDAAKLKTEGEWRTLADDTVTSNITPFFAGGDFIPGLGRDPEMLAEIGTAGEGWVGGPRRTARGWVVFTVAKVRAAGVTPFAEARDEAMQQVRLAKAGERVRVDLEAKRGAIQTAAKLADVAAEVGGTASSVPEHRRGQTVANVGQSEALDAAVFQAPVNALTPVVKIADRGVAIARVTAKKTADMQAFAKDKGQLKDAMVAEELQRIITSMVAESKRENPVVQNSEIVGRFKPRQG